MYSFKDVCIQSLEMEYISANADLQTEYDEEYKPQEYQVQF